MQIMGEIGLQYKQISSACFMIAASFALLFAILDNHWREFISRTMVETSNDACHSRAAMDHRSGPAEREEGDRNKKTKARTSHFEGSV
jgi:hypothetical protein